MEVEHYTGNGEFHVRIGMNGTTPEHEKAAADALITNVLGKYDMNPVHLD